jgi:alcohol dehydrogenase class IV
MATGFVRASGPELRLTDELLPALQGKTSLDAVLVGSKNSLLAPLADELRNSWQGMLVEGPPVASHTPYRDVEAVIETVRTAAPSLLVGFGGGSVIDAVKVVAAHGRTGDFRTEIPEEDAGISVLAIPTTFAASEHTSVAGVSEGSTKRVLRGAAYKVDTAVYTPAAFRSMPREILRDSAVNSLAHALECAYSTNANPISAALTAAAASTLWRHLPRWWAGEDDRLQPLMHGGIQAGFCLRDVGVGLVHAVGHALGARFHLSHGGASAAAMVPSLAVNFKSHSALKIVSDILELPPTAASALGAIQAWLESLGLPPHLNESVVDWEGVELDVKGDFTLPTNPVDVDMSTLRSVLRAAITSGDR